MIDRDLCPVTHGSLDYLVRPRQHIRRELSDRSAWQFLGLITSPSAGLISTQQETLIELAVRSKIMLDSIDAWLLTQPSPVQRQKAHTDRVYAPTPKLSRWFI